MAKEFNVIEAVESGEMNDYQASLMLFRQMIDELETLNGQYVKKEEIISLLYTLCPFVDYSAYI